MMKIKSLAIPNKNVLNIANLLCKQHKETPIGVLVYEKDWYKLKNKQETEHIGSITNINVFMDDILKKKVIFIPYSAYNNFLEVKIGWKKLNVSNSLFHLKLKDDICTLIKL